MIALLIIVAFFAGISLLAVLIATFCYLTSGYKRFQARDEEMERAIIDYSTLKRLYQVNPNAYEFTNCGQLYRTSNHNGWTNKEVRICFKTIFDYMQFQADRKNKRKIDRLTERRKQESAGLEKLRNLAQQDIDNLRAKLDEEFKQEKKKNEKIAAAARQPFGELKPLVLSTGHAGYYRGSLVYVDELGYYFTKDGKALPISWEE